jgi:hypothetical protein
MVAALDVIRKIQEVERRHGQMASSEMLSLLSDDNEDYWFMPTEWNALVAFASDQAARWSVRWQFSSSTDPDLGAKSESESWFAMWQEWCKTLCELVPSLRETVNDTREAVLLHRTYEARASGLAERPLLRHAVAAASRLAIFLNRIKLERLALSLATWALYPPGTVGRRSGGRT